MQELRAFGGRNDQQPLGDPPQPVQLAEHHLDVVSLLAAGQAAGQQLRVVVSAIVQTAGLQQIKAGKKAPWARAALVALLFGLAAVSLQIEELLTLPFQPGQSGSPASSPGFTRWR